MPRSRLTLCILAAFLCLGSRVGAEDQIYTVRGVHLDASSYSASVAQSIAFAQGRPKAWQIMYRRLTRQEDWAKQPNLDDMQFQRLIRNFQVSNERRSTTRYTADITYYFNPAAVASVLKAENIAFTQATAHRILLVPMNPTYTRGSAWTSAFLAPRFAEAVVPFSLPAAHGGLLAQLNFETANWSNVADAALRVRVTEAVLVLLVTEPRFHKLNIMLKRVGVGEMPMQANVEVPYIQTARSTYPAAADAAMSAIAEMWKKKAAVDFSHKGTITVDVKVSSLAQWGNIQSALTSVPNVTGVRVVAMDIGEARISIAYLGTEDQLHDALSEASLQLGNSGSPANPQWTLRQGPPSQPIAPQTSSKQPKPRT